MKGSSHLVSIPYGINGYWQPSFELNALIRPVPQSRLKHICHKIVGRLWITTFCEGRLSITTFCEVFVSIDHKDIKFLVSYKQLLKYEGR